MSLEAHLAELERRHESLEKEIEKAMAQPAADDLEINELKRRKLQIKDQLVRLQVSPEAA
ncbi:YdcH family protein [Afifella sp. IM 167]|uniref:YdcH family protein n=1 Tax=Afifella sp. IM 167 TaxID=2033586 RepID=UPI001CCA0394|nr:DUF465 domain-containing protein [Afifella sp. IM 167]MBZ8133080.1 DUF465 domain-containing protein [Afifella sp. IM 167]